MKRRRQFCGFTSDHFTFHINRLVDLGLVERVARGKYRLTPKGKEYANRLDTDNNTVERQPKSAVLLAIVRQHNGREEYFVPGAVETTVFWVLGLVEREDPLG